jgi:hypothetical protein
MRKALAVSLVLSLSCAPLANASPRPAAAFAAVVQDDDENDSFSPEQLDNLLAPIALYPDPLLAQVLVAATFVDQVDEASRYLRAYGQTGVDDQDWDVAVKAVAHYPVVLNYLADKLDWTTSVGQAYASQSTDVMVSIQRLRRMARSQGNLETTSEQEVFLDDDDIRIVPANPAYLYVPRYSPAVVYYHRPASSFAITFGVGFAIGAWLNRDCDWGGHRVYYHGWNGGGWVGRSRSQVRVTTVYVDPRYSSLSVDRRVMDRHIDYRTLNRYNSVHHEVTYDSFRQGPRVETRNVDHRPHGGNALINRNINTSDPHLDHYRGREDQGLRPPPVWAGPAHLAVPEAIPRPVPRSFGRAEGGFDPGVSSRRGQASREAARRPLEMLLPHPRPTASDKASPKSSSDHSDSRASKKK